MINRKSLMRLSDNEDEDAFDPADFTLQDLDEMEQGIGASKRKYKDFYDDVKTERKLSEEDW